MFVFPSTTAMRLLGVGSRSSRWCQFSSRARLCCSRKRSCNKMTQFNECQSNLKQWEAVSKTQRTYGIFLFLGLIWCMLQSYHHPTSLQWTCLLLCFAQSVSTAFCLMLLLLIHRSKNLFLGYFKILFFFRLSGISTTFFLRHKLKMHMMTSGWSVCF